MSIKKRLGQVKAERAVLILEVLKSVIRLLLLVETKGRSLISPPIPEREVDPTLLSRYDLTSTSSSAVILPELHDPAAVVEATHPNYWKGLKTGYSRPTIASLQPTPLDPNLNPVVVEAIGGKDIVHQYLLTKVLTVEDVTRPEDLVTKLNRLGQLAEVIWILRPVLYGTSSSLILECASKRKRLTKENEFSLRITKIRSTAYLPFRPLPRPRIPFLHAAEVNPCCTSIRFHLDYASKSS